MTLKEWQDQHGGAAGDPEGPDNRGLTTYRAADGAWIVVDAQGRMASQGPSPGVVSERGPGYIEPGTPLRTPARTPGRTLMASTADPNERNGPEQPIDTADQAKQLGVTVLPNHPTTGKQIVLGTGAGQFYGQKVTYADGRTEFLWYERGSGTPGVQDDPVAFRTPGPVATGVRDKWNEARAKEEKEATTEAARGDQEGDTRGPQTGPTREVYRSGKWVVETNPVYQPTNQWHTEGTPLPGGGYDNSRPIMVATVNGQRVTREPTEDELAKWQANQPKTGEDWGPVQNRPDLPGWQQITRERIENGNTVKRTAYRPPGGAEVDTLPAPPAATNRVAVPVQGHPGLTYVTEVTEDPTTKQKTQTFHYENQQGQTVPAPPEAPDYEVKPKTGSDGKQYWTIITKPKDGSTPTIANIGPDGKPVAEIPGEGPSRPTTAGPTMPQIILGQSQEAGRQYLGALQQGVAAGRWSQAWANDRWAEFHQIAQLAVDEARTQQNERESTRNADITLATNRANYAQNNISHALDVVKSINGLLPAGSTLGGQAFAAMLNIGMIQAYGSGLLTINPSDPKYHAAQQANAAAAAPITPAEIANPDALAARRAQAMANPVFRPQEPVNLPPTVQNAGGGPGEPPARGAIPPQPATAPAVTPLPANRPDQTQAAPQIENAINPPQDDTGGQPDISTLRMFPVEGSLPIFMAPDGTTYRQTGPNGTMVRAGRVDPASYSLGIQPAQPGGAYDERPPVFSPVPGNVRAAAGAEPTPTPTPQYGKPATYLPPVDEPNPGGRVRPAPPSETVPPLPPGEVTQVSYPVLSRYNLPTVPIQTPVQQSSYPVAARVGPPMPRDLIGDNYPAALSSEAASRAPWDMSPDDIQRYQMAGVPDSIIWSVPGRRTPGGTVTY